MAFLYANKQRRVEAQSAIIVKELTVLGKRVVSHARCLTDVDGGTVGQNEKTA